MADKKSESLRPEKISLDLSRFQLRRCSDDIVYSFVRVHRQDGRIYYLRTDNKVSIEYEPRLGWTARDPETEEIVGRPWSVFPVEEQDPKFPPDGEWVSKKGVKSYVYELSFSGQEKEPDK